MFSCYFLIFYCFFSTRKFSNRFVSVYILMNHSIQQQSLDIHNIFDMCHPFVSHPPLLSFSSYLLMSVCVVVPLKCISCFVRNINNKMSFLVLTVLKTLLFYKNMEFYSLFFNSCLKMLLFSPY